MLFLLGSLRCADVANVLNVRPETVSRWNCDNLMLFPERMGHDATLELVGSENVDRIVWDRENGLIDTA